MDVSQINRDLSSVSAQSEKNFLALADLFPSLLTRDGGTSLHKLRDAMNGIEGINAESSDLEKELFTGYREKYDALFEKLNEKITELGELDNLIAGMKENSEQMELIALNAMVISIKSGEKGHAFSRITENLQHLSNDMFLYSDRLLEEEKLLVGFINNLKSIFEGILAAQKKLANIGSTGASDIKTLILKVTTPLSEMEENINKIYPNIQKAMESLQLQDIIRQALDHVAKCLDEITNTQKQTPGSDEELDTLCFNITLYKIGEEVLLDIKKNIVSGLNLFQSNWSNVTNILNQLKSEKEEFHTKFLDSSNGNPDNIKLNLGQLIKSFDVMMDEFSHYHIVQKDLLHTCQNITDKAKTMFSVFENLRPVMSRLHHVRILQEIEVSKNDAISSVKDSVVDMDNLINNANDSLDNMQVLLDTFIKETGYLLATFTDSISKDNTMMTNLRTNKNHFFDALKSTEQEISSIIANFNIFPEGFTKKCEEVDNNLKQLQTLETELAEFISTMQTSRQELEKQQNTLFKQRDISSWDIRNDKFSTLINQFTITSHKEVAGKLAGFEVEAGTQAGEITFF